MPGRNLNDTERRLLRRWNSPGFGPLLKTIEITGDGLRGLQNVTIDFKYPLTAIAGKNGVGKSTILACAACAYQNKSDFRTFMDEKPYYNFADFLITGWGDSPPQNVAVIWTYRDRQGHLAIATASKQQTRWDYPKHPDRPDRAADFIGTIRAVHPCELRALHKKFGVDAPVTALDLNQPQRVSVGRIIGLDYSGVQVGTAGKYTLHRLILGASAYSGFNAGSGEGISCLLVRALNHLPKGGLLVVEEIEAGLHASAQRQLASQLLEHCYERQIQVICSTHSSDFLDALPCEARILLVRTTGRVDVRYEVTVAEATSDMVDRPVTELVICVEDPVARTLALELLPATLRKRVRVVRCGSWQDVLRHLSSFCQDPDMGKVVCVLDGDRRNGSGEHEGLFKTYLGGEITDEQKQWLNERTRFFPDTVPPEEWLWNLGRQSADYRATLARHLNAELPMIEAVFQGQPPEDFHDLPFMISQRTGSDEDRALTAMCTAAVATQGAALADIVTFVRTWLDNR